jgi:hypothetical protein
LLEWLLRRAAPQQLEMVMNGSNGPVATGRNINFYRQHRQHRQRGQLLTMLTIN